MWAESMAALALLWALAVALSARGLAWGPGAHIGFTRRVLDIIKKRREPNSRQRLVLAHPQAFLYGNIAADIINFKAYGGAKNNCHNWNIQERLSSNARTDMERAFILGYLCHLAADVIAHNHFIPYHYVRGLPPRFLGHAYWEALADADVTDEEWDIVLSLRRNRALHQNDRLVWCAVPRKALGSRSNKWIFNNILLINLRRSWRELIRLARARQSRYPLDGEFVRHCWDRCVHDMLWVFDEEHLEMLKKGDPTGQGAMHRARLLRQELIRSHGSLKGARKASQRTAREAYWSFQHR